MNTVTQLHTPKLGDHTFMLCGCQPNDPQPFIPIVILQQHPVVVGLMCGVCETQLSVVNGVIQEKNPNDGPTTDVKEKRRPIEECTVCGERGCPDHM